MAKQLRAMNHFGTLRKLDIRVKEKLQMSRKYLGVVVFLHTIFLVLKILTRSTLTLEVFFFERVPSLLREVTGGVHIDDVYPMDIPLILGWIRKLKVPFSTKWIVVNYDEIAANEDQFEINWMPYKRLPQTALPAYCPRNFLRMALCRTVLVCYEKMVHHTPNLSPKQYGVVSIQGSFPQLPKIRSRQSRCGPKRVVNDWTLYRKYIKYITNWNDRYQGFVEQFSNYQPFDSIKLFVLFFSGESPPHTAEDQEEEQGEQLRPLTHATNQGSAFDFFNFNHSLLEIFFNHCVVVDHVEEQQHADHIEEKKQQIELNPVEEEQQEQQLSPLTHATYDHVEEQQHADHIEEEDQQTELNPVEEEQQGQHLSPLTHATYDHVEEQQHADHIVKIKRNELMKSRLETATEDATGSKTGSPSHDMDMSQGVEGVGNEHATEIQARQLEERASRLERIFAELKAARFGHK
ncbi:hypothetical protein ACOSP7_008776 [Xanthoceras sorbifolium]